jgi:hypothetical protein
MSFEEVTAQLQKFEWLSRRSGMIGVESWNPGLTHDAIDEIGSRLGVPLPTDAKAVWAWHNGTLMTPQRTVIPTFGSSIFHDLETAITHGTRILEARNAGDENLYPDSRWLTLARSSVSAVIDITDPSLGTSNVLVSDPMSDPESYPIVTTSERIAWWNWAIENEAWGVGDNGLWRQIAANYPSDATRHLI